MPPLWRGFPATAAQAFPGTRLCPKPEGEITCVFQVTQLCQLRAQDDALSTNLTRTTVPGSHGMSQREPPLVRELRRVVAELQGKCSAQDRYIGELRAAVVALMEPDMPRILRTPGGIMVLDKKR